MQALMVQSLGLAAQQGVAELPDPAPGAGEVLIDVHYAGLNFADALVVDGTYQTIPPLPFVPGKEAAGRVLAVGDGVTGFHPGQPVLAMVDHGAFAQRLVAPAAAVVPVPEGVGLDIAAGFGLVYRTAYFGLIYRARLRPGDHVLVTGAGGGSGAAAVSLAKAYGAHVIGVTRSESTVDTVRRSGADDVIVWDEATFAAEVAEATGGHGIDIGFEVVGEPLFGAVVRALAWEGRLVVVGFAGGQRPQIAAGRLLVRNASVLGLLSADYRDRSPDLVRAALQELFAAYQEGRLAVAPVQVVRLADGWDVMRRALAGELTGKVVLAAS